MLDAQLMISPGNYLSVELYSPWFPRRADNAIFTLDILRFSGSGNCAFLLDVFEKNSDGVGDGSTSGDTISNTAVGRHNVHAYGLKEFVRYRFTLIEPESSQAEILFRVLEPAWFDSAK